MILSRAQALAEKLRDGLAPYCDRIEIAGSIRRQKAEVKDIELVCIPKRVQNPEVFLIEQKVIHPEFVARVEKLEKIKGEATGKYTQRRLTLSDGIEINLDLFMATAENWGLIYAIRTGSAEFSHRVLATGWVRHGYESFGGQLYKAGKVEPVREERDLFNLIGIDYVVPEHRI